MKTLLNALVALAAAVLATSAMAQAPRLECNDPEYMKRETIATLMELKGNVLVSDAEGMSSAVDKQRIKNLVRVTTTSRASVLISFDCGCDVRLKENERLDVEGPRQCPALLAAVQAVSIGAPIGAVAVGTAAVIGFTLPTALLVTGAGVTGLIIDRAFTNVSPN